MAENAPNWIEFPLVTGLMIFDRPQQVEAARASVDCFFAQRWPCKELVVYNSTRHRLSPWWKRSRRITEIRIKLRLPGQMMAVCMENANGEWLIHWQPDCWYDPDYLPTHMQHRHKSRLLVFKHQQVYSLKDRKIVTVSSPVSPCWSFYRHFPVNFEKGSVFEHFDDTAQMDNPANLSIRFASEIV